MLYSAIINQRGFVLQQKKINAYLGIMQERDLGAHSIKRDVSSKPFLSELRELYRE